MNTFLKDSPNNQHPSDVGRDVSGMAFEHHFTPKEIAKLWHKSEDTIRSLFRNEPGVICIASMRSRKGTRRYESLSIPESVIVRVHQRLEIQGSDTRKPRTRKNSTARMAGAIQPASASPTCDASYTADEQWENEILRTARKLRNRTASTAINGA
jgi:hypothetical protein